MIPEAQGKRASWSLAGGRVIHAAPFLVAGIVNVTPDSFFDGGRHAATRPALDHCEILLKQGADILDVGGESTRPGAGDVSESEELKRVVPVIRGAAALKGPDGDPAVVSVDTYRARVAGEALKGGALIVNDISAARFDPGMADLLAEKKPGYVLMHTLGRPREMQIDPRYVNVVDEVEAFFEERLDFLVSKGLPEEKVVLDPGIGFGKSLEHNLALMRATPRFARLGRPIYFGVSNKRWLGELLGLELDARTSATSVATALLGALGASIHRVHDVAGARAALTLAQSLL